MAVKYSWFPGHMAKAMKDIQSKLKGVDLILEVRDARVEFFVIQPAPTLHLNLEPLLQAPVSSGNPALDKIIGAKRRLVVVNKSDLADPSKKEVGITLEPCCLSSPRQVTDKGTQAALLRLEGLGHKVVQATATNKRSMQQVLTMAVQWLKAERPAADMSILMVVGVPNVGKSSLINGLKAAAGQADLMSKEQAQRGAARCGPLPGVTRQLNSFQVCSAPHEMWVLDSPGVMMPDIRTEEAALKLALIGCIKESIIGPEQTVRYLMHLLAAPEHRARLARALRGMPRPATFKTDDPCALAHALMEAVTTDIPEEPWHPGLEDEPRDPLRGRLNMLLDAFGVLGAQDPSQIEVVYMRLLKAFRAGLLGKYMLDRLDSG